MPPAPAEADGEPEGEHDLVGSRRERQQGWRGRQGASNRHKIEASAGKRGGVQTGQDRALRSQWARQEHSAEQNTDEGGEECCPARAATAWRGTARSAV